MTMNKNKATTGGGEDHRHMTTGKNKATAPVVASGGEGGSHMTPGEKKVATAPVLAEAGGEVGIFAAMSNDELVKLWEGIIDEDREAAAELFWEALARNAAAEYKNQEEDHPHARCFEPWQPSSKRPDPDLPRQTAFDVVTVLGLCAPPHLAAGRSKRTPSTACAAQGKEPSSTHDQGQALPTLLRPQTSFNTVTVLCAPPHLAHERNKPPSTTACAPQGKKRRAV